MVDEREHLNIWQRFYILRHCNIRSQCRLANIGNVNICEACRMGDQFGIEIMHGRQMHGRGYQPSVNTVILGWAMGNNVNANVQRLYNGY